MVRTSLGKVWRSWNRESFESKQLGIFLKKGPLQCMWPPSPCHVALPWQPQLSCVECVFPIYAVHTWVVVFTVDLIYGLCCLAPLCWWLSALNGQQNCLSLSMLLASRCWDSLGVSQPGSKGHGSLPFKSLHLYGRAREVWAGEWF